MPNVLGTYGGTVFVNSWQRRCQLLQQIGCVACLLDGQPETPPDIHHLVEGRKRLGNDYTIPLCAWHHRAVPADGLSVSQTEQIMGPSLAVSKRRFVERYGTERELLEFINEAIRRVT